MRWALFFTLALGCGSSPAPVLTATPPPRVCHDLGGTWILEDATGAITGTVMMRIIDPPGPAFSAGGDVWRSTGMFADGRGYYTWTLDSGPHGETTIELLPDGRLRGLVRGDDPGTPNWDYLGTRSEGPPRAYPCP